MWWSSIRDAIVVLPTRNFHAVFGGYDQVEYLFQCDNCCFYLGRGSWFRITPRAQILGHLSTRPNPRALDSNGSIRRRHQWTVSMSYCRPVRGVHANRELESSRAGLSERGSCGLQLPHFLREFGYQQRRERSPSGGGLVHRNGSGISALYDRCRLHLVHSAIHCAQRHRSVIRRLPRWGRRVSGSASRRCDQARILRSNELAASIGAGWEPRYAQRRLVLQQCFCK